MEPREDRRFETVNRRKVGCVMLGLPPIVGMLLGFVAAAADAISAQAGAWIGAGIGVLVSVGVILFVLRK